MSAEAPATTGNSEAAAAPAPAPAAAAPAPPPVVRRGRGSHNQRLRTDEHMEMTQLRGAVTDASSAFTAATSTIVLPTTIASHTSQVDKAVEDTLAEPFQNLKKTIPMNAPVQSIARNEHFGLYEEKDEADTVRQLLFRREKRRRYCMIIGNLQDPARTVSLKLFGHKGLKPFKLQDKMIRLINLSIGKPRVIKPQEGGEDPENAEGAAEDEEGEEQQQPTEEGQQVAHEADASAEVAHADPMADVPAPPQPVAAAADEAPQVASAAAPPPAPPVAAKEEEGPKADPYEQKEVNADDYQDVDAYFDAKDDVVPLTVRRSDQTMENAAENLLARSPVLTSKYFSSLKQYFLNEFKYLFTLEDVRPQNVSININLGAAYCCLARHGSYATQLKHATFLEFVERMGEESMQLYFIKDCPVCVSRAVDAECGELRHEAQLTLVKITFFSNENQNRVVARAVWDVELNGFRLLDMENTGVSFNWTVFSLDETYVQELEKKNKESLDAEGRPTVPLPEGEDVSLRNKTVAYPFEVEFRVFKRWRQHADHPASPLAHAILEKLSIAESNLINHGSSIGYERMDLSHVCEVDFESEDYNVESIIVEHTSRRRPEGTDLLVDNTTSLFIENFAAARQLKDKINQLGSEKVAALQNTSNNNYMRGRGRNRRPHHLGRGYGVYIEDVEMSPEVMREALRPASKLTFCRFRGSTIHWKHKPGQSVEQGLEPLTDALRFLQQVLHTANNIERTSARGGEAPCAL